MKKKSTTIILIVLIIGLIGSGIALYVMNKNELKEQSTTTSPQTSQATTQGQNENIGSTVDQKYLNRISVNEVFILLEGHYGSDYEINCIDSNSNEPIFTVYNKKANKPYARVKVKLNSAIATESIEGSKQTNEFSLLG